MGTCLDDSTEDLSTIQVPSTWRSTIEDPATLQLFLDYYSVTKPPLSNQALECLVRLASVRRSLFSGEAERSAFLNRLVNGTRDVLLGQKGLAEHSNYHEFCRLLGRLKTNYQLAELVRQLLACVKIAVVDPYMVVKDSFYLVSVPSSNVCLCHALMQCLHASLWHWPLLGTTTTQEPGNLHPVHTIHVQNTFCCTGGCGQLH